MGKKKRYSKDKVVYVKEPTLQEAWDVVSRHLEMMNSVEPIYTAFVDWCGVNGEQYRPNLNLSNGKIIVEASETWECGRYRDETI